MSTIWERDLTSIICLFCLFKMKISAKVLEVKVLRVYKSTEISRPESDSEMNNETSNTGRFLFSTCILLFSNPLLFAHTEITDSYLKIWIGLIFLFRILVALHLFYIYETNQKLSKPTYYDKNLETIVMNQFRTSEVPTYWSG